MTREVGQLLHADVSPEPKVAFRCTDRGWPSRGVTELETVHSSAGGPSSTPSRYVETLRTVGTIGSRLEVVSRLAHFTLPPTNNRAAIMKVLEIAFVGYPVTDLKRAIRFYEEALQLKRSRLFGDETTGWLEYDIGPGTVAISNMSPDWKPSPNGGSAGLEVDDFQAAVARLREQKVPFRA